MGIFEWKLLVNPTVIFYINISASYFKIKWNYTLHKNTIMAIFPQYAQNLKPGFILFMQIVDYPLTKLSVDFGSDTRNSCDISLIISKRPNTGLAIHESILMPTADKRIIAPLFLSKASCSSASVMHADVCSRILPETTNTHLQSEKEKSLLCFSLRAFLLSPPTSS